MILFSLNSESLLYESFSKNCEHGSIYQNLSFAKKLIRGAMVKLCFPFQNIWFTKEFVECGKKTDSIIIFDSELSVSAANFIKRKYPNLRVIYWFWNHIYNPNILNKLNNGIELWSYDKVDCKTYNLNYNSQFYFPELASIESDNKIRYDFLFVGAEKGREEIIKKISNTIDDSGLKKKFIVSGNSRKDRRNWIKYSEVIKLISETKCIVDIVPDAQKGMTLRPLESLYFEKKLLTNYNDIEEYGFYDSNNILKFDTNRTNLKVFLEIPITKIDNKVKEYYSFKNWLLRFSK